MPKRGNIEICQNIDNKKDNFISQKNGQQMFNSQANQKRSDDKWKLSSIDEENYQEIEHPGLKPRNHQDDLDSWYQDGEEKTSNRFIEHPESKSQHGYSRPDEQIKEEGVVTVNKIEGSHKKSQLD